MELGPSVVGADIFLRGGGYGLSLISMKYKPISLMKKHFIRKQNPTKESAQKTFNLLCRSLEKVRQEAREKMVNELSKNTNLIGQLRYLLFTKPLRTSLVQNCFAFVVFLIIGAIVKAINNIEANVIYSLFVTILWSFVGIFMTIITPKPNIGHDERWSEVKLSMLQSSQSMEILGTNKEVTIKELKKIIKRAIRYYRLDGEPLKFLLNLSWGGIFIGCLPDPDFQVAMIEAFRKINPVIIWNQNKFGAISLLFIPIIGVIYRSRYGLPKGWLEHVLFQIEVEE